MISILITRGLQSLITSQYTDSNKHAAWNEITRRNPHEPSVLSMVLLVVWALANVVIFVPVIVIVMYTLAKLYPTLAIIEAADAPPSYELVASSEIDIDDDGKVDAGTKSKDTIIVAGNSSNGSGSSTTLMPIETTGVRSATCQPVTSSLLATLRLLRASGGGLFTAYRWRFLYHIVTFTAIILLTKIPHIPIPVACIIVSLLVTKFETAWTHAAVSMQRDGRVWRNLPSYLTVLKATAIPLVVENVVKYIITTVMFLFHDPKTVPSNPLDLIPVIADVNKILSLSIASLLFPLLYTFLLLPTEVILTRTRATMLPIDVSTLVPLDSSIRSQTVVQMGFMSWTNSVRTFSRASQVRITKVYVKIFFITILVEVVSFVLIGAQCVIFSLVAK